MIIVTGGAGFIGSAVVWGLNEIGENDILIVDRLGKGEKWRNLVPLRYSGFIKPTDLLRLIQVQEIDPEDIECLIHLGACSSTLETDADYLMTNNYHYSLQLADWAFEAGVPMIYASSAATYGDGSRGYSDQEEQIESFRPLNIYAYSKQAFDLKAKENDWFSQIVGLKFFNVFGPNEYHKGEMASVVYKVWKAKQEGRTYPLFRSHHPDYLDGEQKRDFVWIKDVVDVILYFFDHPEKSGLYNLGSGMASSFNTLVRSVYQALEIDQEIEYIDMPLEIRKNYQYQTEADLEKLRQAGYREDFTPLEEAIESYVTDYLKPGKHLGQELD